MLEAASSTNLQPKPPERSFMLHDIVKHNDAYDLLTAVFGSEYNVFVDGKADLNTPCECLASSVVCSLCLQTAPGLESSHVVCMSGPTLLKCGRTYYPYGLVATKKIYIKHMNNLSQRSLQPALRTT
jgi:hypothetical protein